jgi:hypothetical protein
VLELFSKLWHIHCDKEKCRMTAVIFKIMEYKIMKPIARKNDLVIQKDTGELFIEDLVSKTSIYLNPTSAYVWEKCDGNKNEKEIAKEMGIELGVSVSEQVIRMAFNKLSEARLIVT